MGYCLAVWSCRIKGCLWVPRTTVRCLGIYHWYCGQAWVAVGIVCHGGWGLGVFIFMDIHHACLTEKSQIIPGGYFDLIAMAAL